jgi:predicted acyltransferase
MGLITLPADDGKRIALQPYIFKNLFAPLASPVNASLAFAICFVLLWLGITAILYRRGIFIKV